jgi:GDP-4-dehydro-6-deoxy-D-mannose reductase
VSPTGPVSRGAVRRGSDGRASGRERILLTGMSGFVGRHLLPAVREAYGNAGLACLVRDSADRLPAVPGATRFVADILDERAVARVVEEVRPTLVLHLAGQASVGQAVGAAGETWSINLGGSLSLARALARFAPEATVLFVSSGDVYGRAAAVGAVTEETSVEPTNPYARSKAAAEAMLADVLPASARLIVTRPLNHIGPGQDERFAIPAFAAQIARIEAGLIPPVLRVGDLSAERDFLAVEDVVEAYLALLRCAPGLPPRSVFNVASGQARRVRDLLDILRGYARVPFAVEPDPTRLRPAEIPRISADASRLTAATGWRPRRTVEDTLARVLEDWRERVGQPATV